MIYFYFILLVISAFAFTADMLLRYLTGIENFGVEKQLFKPKEHTVPADKLLPGNITMLLVIIMTASATGALYTVAGMPGYLSLPCAVFGGMTLCFVIQYFVKNAVDRFKGRALPKGDSASGLDGYSLVDIEAGGWGRARLFWGDREFEVNAAVQGKTPVLSGEKITALYESGGFYFVVRSDKIYKEVE